MLALPSLASLVETVKIDPPVIHAWWTIFVRNHRSLLHMVRHVRQQRMQAAN